MASVAPLRENAKLSSSRMNSRELATRRTIWSVIFTVTAGLRPSSSTPPHDDTPSASATTSRMCFSHFARHPFWRDQWARNLLGDSSFSPMTKIHAPSAYNPIGHS